VSRDTGELAADDTDGLATRREFPSHEFLNGAGIGNVVSQRRQVVESVRVRNKLIVLHVLRDLFVTAVQVTDFRLGLNDHLTIQIKNDTEDTMS
jgi:hypothetical protein